jgi:peptidylprolyl isomerase
MRYTLLTVLLGVTLLLSGCGADTAEPEKVEPAPLDAASSEPAAPAAPEPAPAAAEPAKADVPKPEPAKVEPPAPPKPAPRPAAPKEVTLSSGLRMIDSQAGAGEAAKSGDTVQVHYTGWLYENGKRGSKFDSSLDRGQPFQMTIGVTSVIKGWTEGLVGMKPGGKRELIIPPDLAYGTRGAGGGLIPPDATLDFEIELLQILK